MCGGVGITTEKGTRAGAFFIWRKVDAGWDKIGEIP